jgi:hypothetical protein
VTRAFDSIDVNPENVAAESVVAIIFPGVIRGVGVPLFDYILSRTSYRPREVIQFCNLVLKLATQLDLPSIDSDAVFRAEEEFSVWKL